MVTIYLPYGEGSAYCALLVPALVGLSIAAAELLRRRCPAFAGLLFGGRS